MFAAGHILFVLVLAFNVCLPVCSMPQPVMKQTASVPHCHTEQQQPEEQEKSDPQWRHCCDRDSILPGAIIVRTQDSNHEPHFRLQTSFTVLPYEFGVLPLIDSSPPRVATILRI